MLKLKTTQNDAYIFTGPWLRIFLSIYILYLQTHRVRLRIYLSILPTYIKITNLSIYLSTYLQGAVITHFLNNMHDCLIHSWLKYKVMCFLSLYYIPCIFDSMIYIFDSDLVWLMQLMIIKVKKFVLCSLIEFVIPNLSRIYYHFS